jgi:toxin ParE1/3/4
LVKEAAVRIRYTTPAAADLNNILDYLAEKSPLGADNVRERIRAIERLLAQFPCTGTATRLAWLRRIKVHPFLYLIFYEVTPDAVVIHAVRHAARDPSSMPGK